MPMASFHQAPAAWRQGLFACESSEEPGVRWTYVNPTGDFQANGERIGAYQLGGEELLLNAAGESAVSYADYAIAMVDELESGDHVHQRISVVSK